MSTIFSSQPMSSAIFWATGHVDTHDLILAVLVQNVELEGRIVSGGAEDQLLIAGVGAAGLLWEPVEVLEPELEAEPLLLLEQAVSPRPRARARDRARNILFHLHNLLYIPFIQAHGA